MQWESQNMRLRVDGYTRGCLTAITVLLAILVMGLWAEKAPVSGRVGAAEKVWLNSAAQRKDLVDAQKKTNTKLDELIRLLRSGEVKVQVTHQNLKDLLTGQGGGNVPVQPKK